VKTNPKDKVTKIAMVLCDDIAKQAVPALKFLLLQLNTLQSTSEYEFLPVPNDELLNRLASGAVLEEASVVKELPRFANAYWDFLRRRASDY
jgi:hypothetical protein